MGSSLLVALWLLAAGIAYKRNPQKSKGLKSAGLLPLPTCRPSHVPKKIAELSKKIGLMGTMYHSIKNIYSYLMLYLLFSVHSNSPTCILSEAPQSVYTTCYGKLLCLFLWFSILIITLKKLYLHCYTSRFHPLSAVCNRF